MYAGHDNSHRHERRAHRSLFFYEENAALAMYRVSVRVGYEEWFPSLGHRVATVQ